MASSGYRTLLAPGDPHHNNLIIHACAWAIDMRAISQRAARLLDSNHPSIEVLAFCRPVAANTCFAEPRVSDVLVDSREGSKQMLERSGSPWELRRKVEPTTPIYLPYCRSACWQIQCAGLRRCQGMSWMWKVTSGSGL